ncbi:ABC transporter permease [Paracraurococcus lichenis]|uniref:ABC transporter permease n=1 Tax=Paracraurococcus lichenis TaxID=3064888 RepID=A0ABT9E9A8_9PROT|nr:ABC transporter permease [Paracraurococcus sp. LOR1-02]MDO9712707.1 ABC transporter permease [Paracraurococcus sp. LOR1-02]
MPAYARYLLKRFGQFTLVVFIGVNITFLISHATPIDPVEQTVAAATAFGGTSPEAVEEMRRSLRSLYGLEGGLLQQYIGFWGRVVVGDFGPSLSAFPTLVSTLIARAAPWTVGLLLVSTLLSWVIGNLLGGLAGYYRHNRALKLVGLLAMAVHPIPYYIVALVLLILFGYVWPVLPISGGSGMNVEQGFSLDFALSVLRHSILPALSLVLIGIGSWFLGMRSLVSNVVTDDYVTYAELAGVPRRRILVAYVMRNAITPQITGLAMSIGAIFNGAIITEQVFGYPGIGTLLVEAVHKGDYSLVLGVATISIVTVATAVLVIDLLHPLIDPRVQAAEGGH